MRNLYILISGATDGSIVFWNLTRSIEAFMERLSTLHLEKLIDCQKRPRTGRGSQGGRWWRSLNSRFPKKPPGDDSKSAKSLEESDGNMLYGASCHSLSSFDDSDGSTRPSPQAMENDSPKMEKNSADNSASEISEIDPLQVLRSIHQSGVNCLHVSEAKHNQSPDGHFMYHLVSGGDDQALHCLTFEVLPQSLTPDPETMTVKYDPPVDVHPDEKQNNNCVIKFIYRDSIASGHSSAVKGRDSLDIIFRFHLIIATVRKFCLVVENDHLYFSLLIKVFGLMALGCSPLVSISASDAGSSVRLVN